MIVMLILARQINNIFRNELKVRFQNEELANSLKNSEEKYRIVSDYTSDWEYWQAPDKTFKYISPSCEDFTGYSVQEFINDHELYINIIHLDDRSLFKEHLLSYKSDKIFTGLDFRITRRDREIRWISHICRPVYSDSGEFMGRRISNRDITERKRIEEALKENEEKLRTITHTAQDAIILMDNEQRISFWNPAAEKIFGYTNEEVIGKELHTVIVPEKYRDAYQKGLAAFKLTGAGPIIGTSIELEATKKNGTLIEVELSLSSIKLKGTWHAVGILRDITKRKEADNKLRENEHSLSEAQRIAHIGNWDWNIVTNELHWSDEIYRMFGLTPQQFGATYSAFLNIVHPDDRTALANAVNEAVNNRKPYNLEHRIVHPDGTIRIVSEQGEVSYDENNKALRMIGTVQDITEKKIYEQQLKEANAAKDKFFSIIAHDLKNPFNALLGFAQMLSDNLSELEQDELRDIVSRVNSNAQSAYSLIENLLQWSRAQTGRLEYNPEKIELKTLVEDSFKILAGQSENKQIKLINETQPFNIYADPNLTKTILRNLLSNAIKYTGTGGSVTISSKEDNNMIEVSVSDTGVGMPHEALEKLFRIDTKYSTPGTAKEAGTGLGLILCKEFVEKQGGKIWVNSETGKGSTFTFTLPTLVIQK
jgi:PAS domain S-box-containing protein